MANMILMTNGAHVVPVVRSAFERVWVYQGWKVADDDAIETERVFNLGPDETVEDYLDKLKAAQAEEADALKAAQVQLQKLADKDEEADALKAAQVQLQKLADKDKAAAAPAAEPSTTTVVTPSGSAALTPPGQTGAQTTQQTGSAAPGAAGSAGSTS